MASIEMGMMESVQYTPLKWFQRRRLYQCQVLRKSVALLIDKLPYERIIPSSEM